MSVRSLIPAQAAHRLDAARFDAPPRATPWLAWIIAVCAAVALGALVSSPKFAVVAVGVILVAFGACAILARPINGFLFAFALFPFYTFLRALATLFNAPVPLTIVGLWPELILSLMFTAIVCQAIARRERLYLTWHDLPVLFLLLSMVYSLVVSVLQRDFGAAIYGFHMSATSLLFYFIARWLKPSDADIARLLRVLFGAFALCCVLSLADYFTRTRFMVSVNIAARPDFGLPFEPYGFYSWYPRLQSLLYAEQLFATVCAGVATICTAFLMHGARERRAAGRQRPVLPLLLLSLGCLALTMSRGAVICLVVALFCLWVFFRGRHRIYIGAAAALLIVLVGVIFQTQGNDPRVQSALRRATAVMNYGDANAYDRVQQWQIALNNLPIFPAGIGLGRGGSAAFFHGVGENDKTISDGGIFKIMSEQGIIGVLAFGLSSAGVAYVLFRAARNGHGLRQTLAAALLCWFCGLLVQNVAGNVFDMFYVTPFFWTLAGFAVLRDGDKAAPALPRSSVALVRAKGL